MQLHSWAFGLPSLSLSLTRLSSLKWQRRRQLMLPNVCWPWVWPCGRQGLLYGAAGLHLWSLAINYRPEAIQNRDPLPSGWPSSHLSPSQAVKELHTSTHHPTHLSVTTCLLEGTSKLTFSFSLNAEPTVYHSPSEFQIMYACNEYSKETASLYPKHMPSYSRMNMLEYKSKNELGWYVFQVLSNNRCK